ncbi:sugar phosphate isomerase/epimerase family protein [Metabacillus endolithicus]|uniref:Sugar phosphate isomerase/epimerase family protein n=1 Tax=Metabacillus endolithicus TaxID=1535204 RepID=A0ABW5C3K0_9BACI|nr:sugar phosphate isomerase/epimerase [Metabacillus endolithicus]UPG62596.1 sugar phosphate isomerase/epimerase [Metabacillus endolithicus]
MKFGCSLEMVNMRVSEPGFKHKLSKSYWVELLKFIATSGFKGIELPYNTYSTDGIAFNMARSGMPISKYAINTKYGSVNEFKNLLNHVGIEEVTGVHLNASDALIELLTTGQHPDKLFEKVEAAADEAIDFLLEIGGKELVISPTPEIGLLNQIMGHKNDDWPQAFLSQTADVINRIGTKAAANRIQASIRNEFWSLIRGNQLDFFMDKLDPQNLKYSPDLAHLHISGVDPKEVVEKYKDRISSIRFSDTKFEDLENNFSKTNPEFPVVGVQRVFCDLGDGHIDIKGIYQILLGTGYDGWIICESKKTLNVYKALLKLDWYINNSLKITGEECK